MAKDLIFTGRTIGMEEAHELRLLARCAPAAEAEAQALDLAAGIAAHPSAGLRRLKAMFRDYEDLAARVADENGRLVAFQRDDAGLPMRG